MALTKAQQAAVDLRDRTLLVSAAAGSGKTFSLTKRIIKAIIEDGRDISRLLIVTFTKAAAGELRVKISRAISEAIAEHPENTHLQSQLIKLGNAHISTIDSFFAQPVKANFEKLGLPASLRLSDEGELSSIRDQAMSNTLEKFFDRCSAYSDKKLSAVGYSDRYTELLGVISSARDSSDLIPTLTDIYKKLMTSPEGISALMLHAKRLREDSKKTFFITEEGKALKNELSQTMEYVYKTLSKCCDDMACNQLLREKYLPCFEETKLMCMPILTSLEKDNYSDILSAFDSFSPKAIPRLKSDEKTGQTEYYKTTRAALIKSVRDIAKTYLTLSEEELLRLLSTYADMTELIFDLLEEFDRSYSAEKLRRGVCEFADMPRFVLSLLENKDGHPTEYAKTLADSFDEVYIDEYQDVNEIQDRIFKAIGKAHRFMVGDIKQSIYGFREAEPSIFAAYRRDFPIYDQENDTHSLNHCGSTIFMSENFRCDESVIKFTNAVCSPVFRAFSDGIGYTSDDDLKFAKGRPYEEYDSPKVILNIVEKPPEDNESEPDEDDPEDQTQSSPASKLNDEAISVANEMSELLLHRKNADGSAIREGDIAVLVRSHAHAKPLLEAMSALNIKYILSSKGELFESDEMRIILDLLSVVDNPRSDIPLCHLLCADGYGFEKLFTLEEVISIRRYAEKSKSLFDALIYYADGGDDTALSFRCREFVSLIDKMRKSANKLPADKLLKSLIASERFSVLTQSDAFTYIYDSACRYVKNSWGGLYSFLSYFKGLIEKGDGGGAEPQKNNNDSVTVMTIHQSKGLEFNVCFLFGFGKQFNIKNRHAIFYDRKYGISMKLPPRNKDSDALEQIKTRFLDNPIHRSVAKCNAQMQIEEEARILYVALTRARERLYISATLKSSLDKAMQKAVSAADLSYEISNSRTYISWILLALSHSENDADMYEIRHHIKGESVLKAPLPKTNISNVATNISDSEKRYADLLSSHIRERDDERILATIPSKAAASKVSSHMLDDSAFIPIPVGRLFSVNDDRDGDGSNEDRQKILSRIDLIRSAPPTFDSLLEINKKPTAAEIGTATHLFLQYCDYKNVDENGLDREIERLETEKFISHRVASIINRRQLSGFFKSEFYSYIRTAKEVHREFRFGMFTPASLFTENDELKKIVESKKIFVQGSIDIIIETESGELIICDYKTDRLSAEERADRKLLISNMRERHGEQINQYRTAVEKIFGKPPKKIFIYSLALGDAIEI